MTRRLLALCLLAGALAGCAGAGRPTLSDDTVPGQRCSADGMPVEPLDNDGIPSAVAARRQELIDAAVACDYAELTRLAQDSRVDLRIDGERVPVAQWREREHDGQEILGPLAGILALNHARLQEDDVTRFTWPEAVTWDDPNEHPNELSDLIAVVGHEGVLGWTEAGGYTSWRVSIDADGTWSRYWYGPVDGEYD